jgi:hypothetical protein
MRLLEVLGHFAVPMVTSKIVRALVECVSAVVLALTTTEPT